MTQRDIDTANNDREFRRQQLSRQFGGDGIEVISNTTAVVGREIFNVLFRTDTVFASITDMPGFTTTGAVGPTWGAGTSISVRWSGFTLVSGSVAINKFI